MLCRVWALPRLWQVFPFHKEPKQLDVQIERHVEEGRLSGEQLLVKARGEARGGHIPCLVSTGSMVDSNAERHKANTAGGSCHCPFYKSHCVQGHPTHCQEQEGSQGHSCLERKAKGKLLAKDMGLLNSNPAVIKYLLLHS